MERKIVCTALIILLAHVIYAQQFSISGTVLDQQRQAPLRGASVTLQGATDTLFSRSVITDSAGRFTFSGLPADSFELNVSFIGFNTVTRSIRIDSADVSMSIRMVPATSGDLATVVITSTPPPVTQRGDTVQFNASQYKVNPDASGEDLVRKIPGITVEDGQVKAQGENVQRVTIDGRDLFGDDATAALRNLPAEVIDKIQVFDRLSDQAQFTGFDDGNTSKAINIVTKANMRNGQFGRVFAGYGTDDRYAAGGNATILKENRRISLVGNFNNINQQNFSQQDLLGVTSNVQRGGGGTRGGGQRGGGNRPGQRGGPQGGNFGGFGNSSNFLVGQQNGINQTNAVGINYSDVWGKKVTVSGSYLFNNTGNTTSELANTQYFENAETAIQRILDTTRSEGTNNNHRFNLRLEYRIDSFNQLIITPNLSFQQNSSERLVGTNQLYFEGASLLQSINRNLTNSKRSGNNLNNTILYRRSFPRRGRTFSVNLNTSTNNRSGDVFVNTFLRNIDTTGAFADTASDRFTDQESSGLQVSANVVYTEPLGKNSQLQFNYQPSISKSESDQQTFAYSHADDRYSQFLPNFSNTFENTTKAHNAGIGYRYNLQGRQISFGAAFQQTQLKSDRIYPIPTSVNKTFRNILPNAMIRWALSPKSNIRLMYRSSVNQPSVTQLQDVLDPTNAPVYSLGNPNLDPQFMHTVSSRYTFTNTPRGILLVANVFYQAAEDYIANATFNAVRDTVINGETLTAGYRLTQPVNLDGYRSLRSFLTFAFPLKLIKSNLNMNGGITSSRLPGLLN
ncbi:MAG TPA: TonB-dependent receptor, partial [Flavisolibacter sp.]